jgi:hypothetical protein
MPVLHLGNVSVIEEIKLDPDLDSSPGNVEYKNRAELGKRTTTMMLNEVDGDDRPSRAMNLTLAARFWGKHSDQPPAWVDGDDELLIQLVADYYGCRIGRPKNWKEG